MLMARGLQPLTGTNGNQAKPNSVSDVGLAFLLVPVSGFCFFWLVRRLPE